MAALTALVVAHQATWLLSREQTAWLEWRFPNPPLWLEAADDTEPVPTPWAASTPFRRRDFVEVDKSPVRIAVTAPPGAEVNLAVNGQHHASGAPVTREISVPLRLGSNHVVAWLTNDQRTASLTVHYRTTDSPAPRLLGWARAVDGSMHLVGFSLPETQVFLEARDPPAGLIPPNLSARTDSLGLFALRIDPGWLETAGDDLQLRVQGMPHEVAALPPVERELFVARRAVFEAEEGGSIRASFEVEGLPVELAERWAGADGGRQLISQVFGLESWPPDIGAPSRSATRGAPEVEQIVRSGETIRIVVGMTYAVDSRLLVEEWNGWGNFVVWSTAYGVLPMLTLAGDEIVLEAGEGLSVTRAAPAFTTGGTTRWRGPPPSSTHRWPVFMIRDDDGRPLKAARSASGEPSRIAVLVPLLKGLQERAPKQAWVLFLALLDAVPLVGLLLLSRRCDQCSSPIRSTLAAAAGSLLVFHFLILTAPLYSASFYFLNPLLEPFPQSVRTAFHLLSRLGSVYPVWALGAAVLVRPVFVVLRRQGPTLDVERRPGRKIARWLLFWPGAILVPVAALAALWVMESSRGRQGSGDAFQMTLTVGVLVAALATLWFFLRWLLASVTGRQVSKRTALRASAWMLLFPLLPPLTDVAIGFVREAIRRASGVYPPLLPTAAAPLAWAVIIAGVGAALLLQLSLLAARMAHRPAPLRFLRSPWSSLLTLAYFAACLPLGWVLGTAHRRTVEIWDLQNLAHQVDSFIPHLALLGLGLLIVRSNPDDRFDLPPTARWAGTLIFAFYLAGRTVNLWFIPLPLLFGWVLFDRWVLLRSGPTRAAGRTRLVELILRSRQATRRADQLPKALDKLLGGAKISLEEVAARTARARHAARDALRALPGGLEAAREAVFGTGSEAGPRANARVSLGYGSALAMPFVTLALFEGRSVAIGRFPLLQIASSVLLSASTWLALAFLFGYFFHMIRGRDGLTKALTVSVALGAATVPFRILRAQPLFGGDHLVEMVRLALFVLLLALVAFDLRTLRSLGFRNRDFLAVRGWSAAAGYLGSIVATAAATYLGSELLPKLGGLLLDAAGR